MLAETHALRGGLPVEREENVWPMVPAGKSLHEMNGLDILESRPDHWPGGLSNRGSTDMKHIINALVAEQARASWRMSPGCSPPGPSISIRWSVGRTEDPELSRMTIVVIGDDRVVEQVRKQLAKIISVVKVQDFAGQDVVARDLMLITVAAPRKSGRSCWP